MTLIKTVKKEQEDDLDFASINDDNEVSKVIDETNSSVDKNTEQFRSPIPTLGHFQLYNALKAGDSHQKDLSSPSFFEEIDNNKMESR